MHQHFPSRSVAEVYLLAFPLGPADDLSVEFQDHVRDANGPKNASQVPAIQPVSDDDHMVLETAARSEMNIVFCILYIGRAAILEDRLDQITDARCGGNQKRGCDH